MVHLQDRPHFYGGNMDYFDGINERLDEMKALSQKYI